MELILASTSRYRRELLERLRLPFRSVAPKLDEDAAKASLLSRGTGPKEIAERLALLKAESVAADHPEAAVIGSDQLVAFEGEILGKPGSHSAAVEQLLQLAGSSHDLVTAVAICAGGKTLRHTDVAELRVRDLSRDEVERYVAADQPLDCAGSYRIESLGISLFERIRCDDHAAITGLPLMAVASMLRRLGFALP